MLDFATIVAAIFSVLSFLLSIFLLMCQFLKARKPDPIVNLSYSAFKPSVLVVEIIPQQGKNVYQLEYIQSEYDLYRGYSGIDILGKGKMVLTNPLSKDDFNLLVPAKSQLVEALRSVKFYVDLSDFKGDFYTIQLHCSSPNSPKKWKKQIYLPVRK